MHAFVCASPHVDREVLLEGKSTGEKRTLVFYVEGDREAYVDQLAARPDVERFDVATGDDDGFYVYARVAHRVQDEVLLDAFDRDTVVVVPPIEFRADRTMRLTAIGPPDDLQGVLDDMPDGVDVDVQRVGTYGGRRGGGVTDRQREALAAAWAVGYYDVPRDAGIDAVADELDCAVSTASDLLRRAESTLVGEVLEASF
jgi:hypothetical protein